MTDELHPLDVPEDEGSGLLPPDQDDVLTDDEPETDVPEGG